MILERDSHYQSISILMESLLVTLSLVLQGRTVNLVMRDAAVASAEFELMKKAVERMRSGQLAENGRISRSCLL